MRTMSSSAVSILQGVRVGHPTRQDSVKKLRDKKYNELAKDFETYGRFVNFCIEKKIRTTSVERKLMMMQIFNNM